MDHEPAQREYRGLVLGIDRVVRALESIDESLRALPAVRRYDIVREVKGRLADSGYPARRDGFIGPPAERRVEREVDVRPEPRQHRVGVLLGAIVVIVASASAVLATGYYMVHTVQKDARLAGLPLPVQTVPAAVRVLHETIGASGTIQPSMPVVMTAKVVSRVVRVDVDLGVVVKRGDVLVEMDPHLFEAKLQAARDAHYHAQNQLRRMEALFKEQFASDVELERARTDEATTREAVIQAEIDLANTRVLSPVPGVVLRRAINPGEITQVDQPLVDLGVLDPVMMVAQVSEDKSGSVRLGMRGEVGTDAYPGASFRGTVAKIDSRVNDATRTFGVYIRLANHHLALKDGVTGYARLESTRIALAVPSTAVMNPVGDHATVFVVGKDNKAHLREIRRGLMVGGMTEVLQGLQKKDQVVTVGQFDLHDNDMVSTNHFAPWNPSKSLAERTLPSLAAGDLQSLAAADLVTRARHWLFPPASK